MTTTLTEMLIGVPAAASAPLALGFVLLLVLRAARKAVRPARPAVALPPLADEVRRAA